MLEEDDMSEATVILRDRQLQLDRLKIHLASAQNRMKLQADRRRSEKEFAVGDKVFLKLQPYIQSSLVNRPFPKLAFKFFGPYEILERIGAVAYRLNLPVDSKIHPVFHVSQLKDFVPDHTPIFTSLPKIAELDTMDPVPEAILDRRLVKKGNSATSQGLIKWETIPAEAATWEDLSNLKKRFPSFDAWGQASASEEGSVTPGLCHTGEAIEEM
jgi:hypothetical protein